MLRELSMSAQALSDPTRLRILKLLSLGDLCVCELVYLLPASQSRVSQNLSLLKYAGLVTDQRQGRWVYYSLNRPAFEAMVSSLRILLDDTNLDSLPEMAAEAERWREMQVDNPRAVCSSPSDESSIRDILVVHETNAKPDLALDSRSQDSEGQKVSEV